nr:hypothetical protein BCU55_04720 [Shewanella sp. 10N.286.48.A6]
MCLYSLTVLSFSLFQAGYHCGYLGLNLGLQIQLLQQVIAYIAVIVIGATHAHAFLHNHEFSYAFVHEQIYIL